MLEYISWLYPTHGDSDPGSRRPLFAIPTIREYFVDLDYILGVIADGPTKSFAYRRLKYLISKWTMYSLLNEFQEMADMKVTCVTTVMVYFTNHLY